MSFINFKRGWVLSLLFLAMTGVQGADPSPTDPKPPERESYVILAGDKLNYRVIEDRDDPRLLTVSPTGELEIPYFGRVQVGGKSLIQATQDIRKLLEKDLYHQATVLLSVEETSRKAAALRPKQVFVVGQVRLQGAQELPSDAKYTVSQAIVKAGGFGSFANGKRVQLIRKTPDGKGEKITVDVQSVFKDGNVENDVELKPDDMIIVPEKLVNF